MEEFMLALISVVLYGKVVFAVCTVKGGKLCTKKEISTEIQIVSIVNENKENDWRI